MEWHWGLQFLALKEEGLITTTKMCCSPGWTEKSAYRKQELNDTTWSTIFLHLSDNVIRKVGETTSAEALWTKLESLYLTKTMPNKCYLLMQFYNFIFDPSSNLEKNLDRFTKLIQDLPNCDEKISMINKLLLY